MTANEHETGRRARTVLCLLVGVAMLFMSLGLRAQEPSAAVWKLQEISFFYRSYHARYPCHELQKRVAIIMVAIGARDDIDVRASDCNDFTTLREPSMDRWEGTFRNPADSTFRNPADRFKEEQQDEQRAHVRIRMMYPIEVTPQVLKEIDRDKSRRELVSRVTGNKAAAMNDPIVFAARRQPVTLSRELIRLEPRDCELLEQMSRSVFRELKVTVVRGNTMCDRDQVSRMTPQVTVEALLPVISTQQIPGAAQFEGKGEAAKEPAGETANGPAGDAAKEPATPPSEPAQPVEAVPAETPSPAPQ